MIKSKDFDIIGIYRSQEGDMRDLIRILDTLIDKTRITVTRLSCFNVKTNCFILKILKNYFPL